MKRLAALIFAIFSQCAVAYSPAPGLWFNANESGRGYTIDFQNGIMVVTVFIYNSTGAPTFYQAAGVYNDSTSTLTATMAEFHGGQCFGCAYVAPSAAAVGTLKIVFNSPETGILYFPGGSTPIAHELFGYNSKNDYLYGEWAFDINIGFGIFDTAWLVFNSTFTGSDGTLYIAGAADNVSGTAALGAWNAGLAKFVILYDDDVGYSHEYILSGDDHRLLGLGALFQSSLSPPIPTSTTSGCRLLFKDELSGGGVIFATLKAPEHVQITADRTRLQALADRLQNLIGNK